MIRNFSLEVLLGSMSNKESWVSSNNVFYSGFLLSTVFLVDLLRFAKTSATISIEFGITNRKTYHSTRNRSANSVNSAMLSSLVRRVLYSMKEIDMFH